MKLESKLYKFESQKVSELSKIIGGQVQETKYSCEAGCGHDKMDTTTNNGYICTNQNGVSSPCDFATYEQLASPSVNADWAK